MLEEGIDVGGLGIRDHQHVALVDLLPAADRRPVEAETVLEDPLVDLRHRIGAVLLLPGPVGEPQVHDLGVVLLG